MSVGAKSGGLRARTGIQIYSEGTRGMLVLSFAAGCLPGSTLGVSTK